MSSISILKDVVRDSNFGVIVKEDESLSFYGFHELGAQWAQEAQTEFIKSGAFVLPEGISQTAFKTVPKTVIETILVKTIDMGKIEKSFTETFVEKISVLRPIFSERVKSHKIEKIYSKSLDGQINEKNGILLKINKINFRARKFVSTNQKFSLSMGIKNSGITIDGKSGSIVSTKLDDLLVFRAKTLQEKLGDGFARRIIRIKTTEEQTNSTNRRALRRAKSISPKIVTGKTRIDIAKKEIDERF